MKTTKVVAGEAIKQGDIVAVGQDGKVRYVLEPNTPGAQARPLFQAERIEEKSKTQTAFILGMSPVPGQDQKAMSSVTLANGNYAVGFTADTKYKVALYSHEGNLISKTDLGFASTDAEIALAGFANSKIAVAIKAGSSGCVDVVVLDEEGKKIDSALIGQSEDSSSISIATLSNGNAVVVYANDKSRHEINFAVFKDNAEAVGGMRRVDFFDKVTTYKQSVAVTALTEGFAVVYGATDGVDGKVFFKLYSNGGVETRPRHQVGENIARCEDAPFVTAFGLAEGGFAVGSYGGVGPGFQLNIVAASGDINGNNIILAPFDNYQKPNRLALTQLSNGNIGVLFATDYVYGSVYTPQGHPVFTRAYFGRSAGSVAVAAAAEGAVVAFQGINEDDGTLQLYAGHVGPLMYGDVAMTAVEAANPYSAIVVGEIASTLPYQGSTMLFAGGNVDNEMVQIDIMATYTIQAQSVLGVAQQEAHSDGETIVVAIEGDVQINTPFKLPYRGDHREAAIPGQYLAVVGDTAFLKGIH